MSDESPTEEITLAELLLTHGDEIKRDTMVAMPAKVESYNASAQTVDVVPQLNRSLDDGSGNFVTETLPKINDVPVCFPRAGGFFVSFPIQAGDFVLLVCCDRNIGQWRATGAQGDPGDLGMHTLDGAVAIPGVFPDQNALNNADGTNMVLGSDSSGSSRIVIKPSGQVDVGAAAAQFVAMSEKVLSELNNLSGLFDLAGGHKHSFVGMGTVGPPIAGLGLNTTSLYTPSSVASTNLKAED